MATYQPFVTIKDLTHSNLARFGFFKVKANAIAPIQLWLFITIKVVRHLSLHNHSNQPRPLTIHNIQQIIPSGLLIALYTFNNIIKK
jgi:hypothetical protein